ncbi:alpha/beta hydrolase fold domain-containing protein [Zhihengliuella halotolerans]|uniref:alpha/beta hydrolase fold domain-containing protein n=1 Tax=Zhihengliuella halotolerans TaxID=370736 RepID=UPI000C7FB30F|nr:alpha/beta hydrolase fold domain-containing protein [Zhihengliuella halotolerans]
MTEAAAAERTREEDAVARLTGKVQVRDGVVAGRHGEIPIRMYTPAGRAFGNAGRALVWAHGGAFCHGGLDQLESHAVAAAVASRGNDVVAIDYRLAPEWEGGDVASPDAVRYPIPVDDVVDAYRHVRNELGRPVAIGGASAGACLAAAATWSMLRGSGPAPNGLALVYPTVHAALPPIPEDLRAALLGPWAEGQFTATRVHLMNRNYAGGDAALGEAYAFPGGHDLAGFPRTLVLDADHDALRASGAAFADELRAAGTGVRYEVVAGTRHGFMNRPAEQAFGQGIDHLASWLSD